MTIIRMMLFSFGSVFSGSAESGRAEKDRKKLGAASWLDVMIGKYEREDNSPSIEVIVKLAKAFQVSVDYLLGEGPKASYDKEMIKRLDELETLPDDEKQHIFHYMDLVVRDYKTKKTYNPK